MEIWLLYLAWVIFLASGIWVWNVRRHMRKMLEQMDHMLEQTWEGSFQESVYDESMLSHIETKLAHYLAASEVSARNLTEEKEKIKQLIADISHQTKTPIANLLLYVQMLEEKELPQEEQAFVQEINRQAQKLNFLIGSLVKTSRLETGMLVLHPKWEEVDSMLEEVIRQLAAKAQRKGQTIEFAPGSCFAWFDRKWTVEAIYNIVDNAVKYTPDGGKIKLVLTAAELFVRIEIMDTGIGIKEEETVKIFQRFYRGSHTSGQEGVGIGLYLARQILAGENGYIKVKSVVGGGSSFFVYLPVQRQSYTLDGDLL